MIGVTCGEAMAYNIFGQFTPDSYCNITGDLLEIEFESNHSFYDMRELIMEPPNVAKVNAENCFFNDDIKFLSTKENGGCDDFIFDDSIMKSTIGRVLKSFTCSSSTGLIGWSSG